MVHFHYCGIILKGKTLKKWCILLYFVVLWSIWLVRNEIIFKEASREVIDIVILAKCLAREWFRALKGGPINFEFVDWLNNPLSCLR